MTEKQYLHIGKASDIKDKKERLIFRLLEIFPGALTWATLFGVVLLSWIKPDWAAIFIILFATYWLLRTIYFILYLRSGYEKMKRNEKIDWLKRLEEKKSLCYWKNIYHLVIFPMYKEPLEIIRSSILALYNTDYPKDKMIVVLAIEEKEGIMAQEKAEIIKKELGDRFFKFIITSHPSNLPGEISGKGSNETWAVKEVKKLINILKIPYENILISSLDADTAVFPKYFSCLTYHYLTSSNPTRTSFQPDRKSVV